MSLLVENHGNFSSNIKTCENGLFADINSLVLIMGLSKTQGTNCLWHQGTATAVV